LQGKVAIPSWNRVSTLSSADQAAILKLDPFFNGGPNLTTNRFKFQRSIHLVGPRYSGDLLMSNTLGLTEDTASSTSSGIQIDVEAQVGWTFKVPVIGKLGASAAFAYQYQKIRTHTDGMVKDAQLTLGTNNQCVHAGFDVYQDQAFNSF